MTILIPIILFGFISKRYRYRFVKLKLIPIIGIGISYTYLADYRLIPTPHQNEQIVQMLQLDLNLLTEHKHSLVQKALRYLYFYDPAFV